MPSADTSTDILIPNSRILYVDPNDIYGKINGVPITPDYSDFCIAFDLQCEIIGRYKSEEVFGQSSDGKYNVGFVRKVGVKGKWASLLQGEAYKDDNVLTTYYTDINYDNFRKETIVEGLGVESIDIAFEAYYSPNITIKFVDHRGSALFGREEAIHYNDKLTIDNIFGAFFAIPYPKFRLQVKGFLGKAVTYQLSCTSFKGSLNSQTGNFEAVATFVGYSYSLLTDIPFEYLVAAPYCKYVGEDYWKAHRSTDEWRLDYGTHNDNVPTLYEIFQRISAAFNKEELLKAITNDEQATVDIAENEVACLDSINDYYLRFLNSIDDVVLEPDSKIRNYEPGNPVRDAQILYMSKETDFGKWVEPKRCWDNLMSSIDTYNKGFKDNKITEDVLPIKPDFDNIKFTPFFVKAPDGNGFVFKDIKEVTTINLATKKINGNTITESLAGAIIDFMNKKHSNTHILPNVYLLDCGGLSYLLEHRTAELKTKVSEINRKAERNYIHLALNELGFVPYIGNIFKIILCHIETLIYMMSQCYENIMLAESVGQRSAAYLGVNRLTADFNGQDDWNALTVIPPWPAVNKKDDGDTEYSNIERYNTLGWVGDFSNNFEEAKLVKALYAACQHIAVDPSKLDGEEKVKFLYAPILPNDLNNNRNPFDRGEKRGPKALSALGGMLGIRIAHIFGVGELQKVPDEIAREFGKIDALNYYRFVGDKAVLREDIISKTDSLADTLYDIMLCNPSADKYCAETDEATGKQSHDFEFTDHLFNNIPNRQPIFVEFGNALNYTYMPNSKGYGIVPSNTRYKDEYREYIASTEDNTRHYIKVDYLNEDSFLHFCTATQLFEDYKNPEESVRKYKNREMYCIVTGKQHVQEILERYDQMSKGTIKVLDGTYKIDMSKVLKRYWYVDKSRRYEYMLNTIGFFSKSYQDCGINDTLLLSGNFDTSSDVKKTYEKLVALEWGRFFSTDAITMTVSKEKVDPNNLIIPRIMCVLGEGKNFWYDLFGFDFYYMQNQIQDADTKNRVKALLFLHALNYNKNLTMKWDVTQINHSCISRIPFGLAALYGGLLWRHKYILDHTKDPILYGDGNENVYRPAYTKGQVEYTLFGIDVNNNWCLHPRLVSESSYHYPVFGWGKTTEAMFVHYPDYMVVNELIAVFDKFLNNQWQTISQLELRKSDGSIFANGASFRAFVNELQETYKETIANKEVGTTEYINAKATALQGGSKKLASFTTNYSFLYYNLFERISDTETRDVNDRIVLWLNPANTAMQEAIRSTYIGDCIELRSMCTSLSDKSVSTIQKYTDIVVYTDNAKTYINGFVEQLKFIVDNPNNNIDIIDLDAGNVEDTPEFNRETALPIYLYLKMLWDKWLVSLDVDDNKFSVKNFNKNFIFIDSFYRNIAHRFMINCQLLLDCYTNNMTSNRDIPVFKFIGDLTTKHNCMFVSVPDFISDWAHRDSTLAAESLASVFRPVPYSEMKPPEENNKFVTIYIPKLSESPSELNNFRDDGFNIWSYNDVNKNDQTVDTRMETLPEVFRSIDITKMDPTGKLTRYGYYVPSFGLAYGRQNNHIFKSINLSMDAPIMTSAVINTLSHTSRMGARNTHRVAFIGQDIYPVFSNYSYICEFVMMGCAQIQPLMYFQLMNVPMWRGTYIIVSVTHSLTPGNMVTRVRAMKLSNRAVPYSNAWFTENPNFDINEWRKRECLNQLVNEGIHISVKGTAVDTPPNDDGSNNNNNGGESGVGDIGSGGKVKIVNGKYVNDVDSRDVATNVKRIYKMFINAGATDQCARAILANVRAESGQWYNPRAFTWDGHMNTKKYTEKQMVDSQGPGGGLIGFKYPGGLKGLALANGWTVADLDNLRARMKAQIPYPLMTSSKEKHANQEYIKDHIGDFPFTLEQQVKRLISLKAFQTVKTWTDPVKICNYWEDVVERPDSPSHTRWQTHGSAVNKYLGS